MVLVLTRGVREDRLPREFHRRITLRFPSEESQFERWERHLEPEEAKASRLAKLVERHFRSIRWRTMEWCDLLRYSACFLFKINALILFVSFWYNKIIAVILLRGPR